MTALRVLLGLLLTCGAAAQTTVYDLLGTYNLTLIQLTFAAVGTQGAVARAALEGPGPVTLFGLTDEAAMDRRDGLSLTEMFQMASPVLESHIVEGVGSPSYFCIFRRRRRTAQWFEASVWASGWWVG